MKQHLSSTFKNLDFLTEENHCSNRKDAVREYFGFNATNEPIGGAHVKFYTIIKWADHTTPIDAENRPLDILYIINEDIEKSFWIPLVEYNYIKELKSINPNANSLSWSYLNGRSSYLGRFASGGMTSATMDPGYQIFIEMQYK